MNTSLQQNIKIILNKLATLCLENSGNKTDYTDEELSDATLVFMELVSNRMFDRWAGKIPEEEVMEMGTKLGKDLRKLVRINTGVDMHDVYKDIK